MLDRHHELEGYIAGSGAWLSGNRLLYLRPLTDAKSGRGLEMVTQNLGGGTITTIRNYPKYTFDFTLQNEDGTSIHILSASTIFYAAIFKEVLVSHIKNYNFAPQCNIDGI